MSLPIKERQMTMFREKFHQFLDPKHELMRAGRLIPWDTIHDELWCYYSKRGRRPKFIRLMVGIHILKHRYNVSDEQRRRKTCMRMSTGRPSAGLRSRSPLGFWTAPA
jgi:hypothetical protein